MELKIGNNTIPLVIYFTTSSNETQIKLPLHGSLSVLPVNKRLMLQDITQALSSAKVHLSKIYTATILSVNTKIETTREGLKQNKWFVESNQHHHFSVLSIPIRTPAGSGECTALRCCEPEPPTPPSVQLQPERKLTREINKWKLNFRYFRI